MVRVAGLNGQVSAGVSAVSDDGMTPAQQLAAINQRAGELLAAQQTCWRHLRKELCAAGVAVVEPEELTKPELDALYDWFMAQVFPILTPLAVDPAHPFPFIPNGGLVMVLSLIRPSDGKQLSGLVMVPHKIDRFVRLPGGEIRFLAIERLVVLYLDRSEEHTSELQSLMRISYAVFYLTKKN